MKPGSTLVSLNTPLFSKQEASSKTSHVRVVLRCQMFVVTTGSVKAASS